MQVFYSLFMSEPALFHNTAGSFLVYSLCKYIIFYDSSFIYDSSLNSNNSISLSSLFLRSLSRSSIVNTLSTS